ncbi:DUF3461 family protein [Amphritea sp. HPY]|uniref:DUF3461 family protein n=1 Tax=Amphritea sp. HPY TaxID=3421652 RepID=UPI003D7CB73F
MSEYTTLQAMGLTEIDSISHYKLSNKDDQEILKIYFKRPEGSTLPNSSSFCFERNKVVAADSKAQAQSSKNSGSDPVLIGAIDELNSLSKAHNNGDRRAILLNELDRLEQVMASKIRELREDLARI